MNELASTTRLRHHTFLPQGARNIFAIRSGVCRDGTGAVAWHVSAYIYRRILDFFAIDFSHRFHDTTTLAEQWVEFCTIPFLRKDSEHYLKDLEAKWTHYNVISEASFIPLVGAFVSLDLVIWVLGHAGIERKSEV